MGHLSDGTLLGEYETNWNIIGAGGFLISGDQSMDGTLVMHCDSTNPYYRKPGDKAWTRFLRMGDNYTGSTLGMNSDFGSACKIARNNSDVMMAIIAGHVMRTTDGGTTVVRLTVPKEPDWTYLSYGKHFQNDPANEDVWLYATTNGLLISDDKFNTWTTVPLETVPIPVAPLSGYKGRCMIAFDEHSPVVGGKTQGIYICVPGHGIYHTTNAGATWARMSFGPPAVYCNLTVDASNGHLHVMAYGGPDKVQLNGSWVQSSVSTEFYSSNDRVRSLPDHLTMQGPNPDTSPDAAPFITIPLTKGTLGSLAPGQYAFGDNDSIGQSRLYARMPTGAIVGGELNPGQYADGTTNFWYDNSYWRWNGTEWLNTVTSFGNVGKVSGVRVVVDPHTPGRLLIPQESSQVYTSLDHGLTWSGGSWSGNINKRRATNIPWLAWTQQAYMAHGDMWFDRNIPGRLHLQEGIGWWFSDTIPNYQTEATPIWWNEYSVGIENMTSKNLNITSKGALLYACWDRVAFGIPKDEIGRKFPITNGPNSNDVISVNKAGSNGVDFVQDNPDFVVASCVNYGPTEVGGYSTNEGKNWNSFTGSPGASLGGENPGGGNIVALSETVYLNLQINSKSLVYTVDGGATWALMNEFFGPNFHQGASYGAHYLERKVLVRDRYNPNTAFFYCVSELNSGSTVDLASRGLWKIVYNGPGATPLFTCTRQRSSPLGASFGQDYWNGKLVQHEAGWWLWTSGADYTRLRESRDDGVTWSIVTGIDDQNGDFGGSSGGNFGSVYAVAGNGAPAFPGEPRTVVVFGHRPPNGASFNANSGYAHTYYGAWLCRNFTAPDAERLWERITQYPGGVLGGFYGRISDIVLCPVEFGKIYCANGGGGVFALGLTDRRRASAA